MYTKHYLISDTTFHALHNLLSHVASQVNAHLLLLADPAGQELSTVGYFEPGQAETLAALAAAQLGACRELVHALRLRPTSTWLIREGPDFNTFLSTPVDDYVLLLVAPADLPLGWVRHVLKQNQESLADILADLMAPSSPIDEQFDVSDDFVSSLLESMDSLWEVG